MDTFKLNVIVYLTVFGAILPSEGAHSPCRVEKGEFCIIDVGNL